MVAYTTLSNFAPRLFTVHNLRHSYLISETSHKARKFTRSPKEERRQTRPWRIYRTEDKRFQLFGRVTSRLSPIFLRSQKGGICELPSIFNPFVYMEVGGPQYFYDVINFTRIFCPGFILPFWQLNTGFFCSFRDQGDAMMITSSVLISHFGCDAKLRMRISWNCGVNSWGESFHPFLFLGMYGFFILCM